MRRFNREASITARLGHPGIPVLYFGADEGELFMVMEHGPATEARPWERHLDSRCPQSVIDD
jgi:serine/threonine protein kinase